MILFVTYFMVVDIFSVRYFVLRYSLGKIFWFKNKILWTKTQSEADFMA